MNTEIQRYRVIFILYILSLCLCISVLIKLIEESRLFVLYALLAVNGGKDALHLS